MYTLFKYEGKTNDKYSYGDIYGLYQGKWQYIHSFEEWQILSAINKEHVFLQCSQEMPTKQILNDFIPFSMLTYNNDDKQLEFDIDFIPKLQLIVMKDLINLDQIDRILSIDINATEINGLIYILLTNGIKNENNIKYYTYKFKDNNNLPLNLWIPILETNGTNHFYLDSTNKGLTIEEVRNLSAEDIDKLFTDINKSKLGFTFLYVPLRENAQLQINNIDLVVNAKGIWESTQVGVDYTYNYPDNSHININIKKKGKYKINYFA